MCFKNCKGSWYFKVDIFWDILFDLFVFLENLDCSRGCKGDVVEDGIFVVLVVVFLRCVRNGLIVFWRDFFGRCVWVVVS